MVDVVDATRTRGKLRLTDWAYARFVTLKTSQPNKLVTFCAVRNKPPPGSHYLGADGAFNEGGVRAGPSGQRECEARAAAAAKL